MRIALLGFGKMGREIKKIAVSRSHEISIIIDKENQEDIASDDFKKSDVAIEFSTPETAYENIIAGIYAGVPVVSGTTGWLDKLNKVTDLVESENASFIYASNFSIGVNILFNLNQKLAGIMDGQNNYKVSIEEIHHTQKVDSPSGTAMSLAEDIIEKCKRLDTWVNNKSDSKNIIGIESFREGQVPGTHSISWESETDSIQLMHKAFGRQGFAFGAVFAAEYIQNRKGVFTMDRLLGFK